MNNFFNGFTDELTKLGGYFSDPQQKQWASSASKPIPGNTRSKSLYKSAPKVQAIKTPRPRKGTRPVLTNIQ